MGLYEQSIAFGTDAYGLERLLRFFQALSMIFTSFPEQILPILTYLSSSPIPETLLIANTRTALRQATPHLGLVRRWIRTFRFFDYFNASYALYTRQDKTLDIWLDTSSKTCLGLWGLLETLTLPDALNIDHVEIFGPELTKRMNLEAMRFWLLALILGALSGLIKMMRTSSESKSIPPKKGKGGASSEKARKEAAKKSSGEFWGLAGKILFLDLPDMTIPASALGLITIDAGVVGILMIVTTYYSSLGIWKACGQRVSKKA